MSSSFITNSSATNLKDRINQIITASAELKFLVGFFYFSGLDALYKSLISNPKTIMNVLVGLNVDHSVHGLQEYEAYEKDPSRTMGSFFESVKRSLNGEEFDNKQFYEQAAFFIKMIQEGRLVIRKTVEPNHAKLYIFKLNDQQVGRPMFITGSSNLTSAGLSLQHEFNVEISDYGYDDANSYFDELWRDSIEITEDNKMKHRLIRLLEEETHIKKITPFEAYASILKHYIDSFRENEISGDLRRIMNDRGYRPYMYQLHAVQQALAIIEDNGGVLVADVVGLGKSVIASMIAKEIGKRGIVICPPALMGTYSPRSGWRKYIEDFELKSIGWDVHSAGSLEKVQGIINDIPSIETIIIDEAHRFRNQDTQDYHYLSNICRGKKVILLTATPFNNRPDDLLSLLQLFISPKKSSITLDDNIKDRFAHYNAQFKRLANIKKHHDSSSMVKKNGAIRDYVAEFNTDVISIKQVQKRAKEVSKEIRGIIEPVIVRRNRLDLINHPDYKHEIDNLSVVEPPEEWFYPLTIEQSKFYDYIIKSFSSPEDEGRFVGAIYQPSKYEINGKGHKQNFERLSQRNLYDFMRRLLIKRFESSCGAFDQTIQRFISINNKFLTFLDASGGKFVLDRKLIESLYDKDYEDIEKGLKEYEQGLVEKVIPKNKKVYNLKDLDSESFIEDIKSDIQLFKELSTKLSDLAFLSNDPKSTGLINEIKTSLRNDHARKIIIFTEYADTVRHLSDRLNLAFHGEVLTIDGALNEALLRKIQSNFDASETIQANTYRILLTTDKLAEGFNLNRAGMVVNYDIPWNPVKVIQRVGRINRMSKKVFDSLKIRNFFPTEKGAEHVKIREIAQHKMFLIHNTLGEDLQVFDVGEEPTPSALFNKLRSNPELAEGESFFTRATKDYRAILRNNPDLEKKLKIIPKRVKVSKGADSSDLLVFIKKGRLYVRRHDGTKIQDTTVENIYEYIKCRRNEPALALSNNFWDRYEETKEKYTPAISRNKESFESSALTRLGLLRSKSSLDSWATFIDALREDITDYGSLPNFTLRKISDINDSASALEISQQLRVLHDELGGKRYENNVRRFSVASRKEIIIAIENQFRI